MIDRFDHLHIQPADFDLSLAFYRDTLGWSVVSERGGQGSSRRAVLSGGAMKVVLTERPGSPGAGEEFRPAVHLDIHDVDKRFATLASGDCVAIAPGVGESGSRRFVVRDPDGNLIAFEESHRNRG